MDQASLWVTVTVASVATGLVAAAVICVAACCLRATLFSWRWFLVVVCGVIFAVPAYVIVIHLAVNWRFAEVPNQIWVDPGTRDRACAFSGVVGGALLGGVIASRRARQAPPQRP